MADKASNVVLNFKMDGQVEYAKTVKEINTVMNVAAKEYRNHVAEMGKDASATEKLAAEKKKLDIQLKAAQERTKLLSDEYKNMTDSGKATTTQLANMYGKLLDSERAEDALSKSMDRVNEGMSEQAEQTRKSEKALEGLSSESEKLGGSTQKLNAEYELQRAQLGENASEADKLNLQMDHLNKSHEVASEQVSNYEKQLEEAKLQYGENSDEINKYEVQLLEARTTEEQFKNEIDKTSQAMTDNVIATSEAAQGLDNLKTSEEDLTGTSERLNKEYELQKSQLGENASETEKLKAEVEYLNKTHEVAAEQVKNYEQQLQLAKEQYGENSVEVREYENKLLDARLASQDLSNELGSTTEKLKEQEDAFRLASEKIQKYGDNATKVGTSMTKLVTAPIVGGVGAMFALSKASGATADRLLDLRDITGLSTDSIQEWQYVSQVAGVEQEALTKTVEGFIKKIPQLEAEGGKATEAMETLGLSYEKLKSASPDDQIDMLMKKLSEMEDPMKRNATGAVLFGGAWKDIAPILGMGADAMAETREEAHELGAVLSEDSLNDANAFRIAMDKITATLTALFNQIGADLAPMMEDVLVPIIRDQVIPVLKTFGDFLGGMVSAFAALPGPIQKLIVGFLAVAAAVGPVLVAVGFFLGAISNIVAAVGPFLGILSKVGPAFTVIRTAMMALTGPVGLIIAAIGLIAVVIYKNWDSIKEFLLAVPGAIAKGLKATFDGLFKALNFLLEGVTKLVVGFFTWLPGALGAMFSFAGDVLRKTFSAVFGFLDNKLKEITQLFVQGFVFIKDAVSKGIDVVINFFKEFGPRILLVLSGPIGWIVALFVKNWSEIKKKTEQVFNAIKDFVLKIWTTISDKVKKIVSSFVDGVLRIWDNLKNGTKKSFDFIYDLIMKIWNTVKDSALKVIKLFVDGIEKTFSGLKKGVEKTWDGVKNAIVKPIELARDAVKKAIEKIKGFFNFEFKWPKLKMPTFSSKGSFNPAKWASEGLPKIDVKWNAKGGVFTKPTIFGKSGGQLQGAGEAGPEAVLPLNEKTLGEIGRSIAATMSNNDNGGDLHLTVEIPIDGEIVARKTIRYTMREMYNEQQKSRRGRK